MERWKMKWNFEQMYSVFSANSKYVLLDGMWGIEREAQRVIKTGELALSPHPKSLGDKLTNPEITTDFSESQIELITPAFSKIEEVHNYMEALYEKVVNHIGEEYLWPISMPPCLPQEDKIPIAEFGDNEEGKLLNQYRQGLASRYGKKMQMISGIHYNFSFGEQLLGLLHNSWGKGIAFDEFRDYIYFAVARNFLRYRWLLIYLLGASPVYDETYTSVIQCELEKVKQCCPSCCHVEEENYATSYRVSRYGYFNTGIGQMSIRYNSKKEYVRGIKRLLKKKSNKFAKLEHQLSDRVLQKDSEFYSAIRLKQVTKQGESQTDAINQRGVKYAEVRILDIDPYEKAGIGLSQLRFLQVFTLFCLMEQNTSIGRLEMKHITNNHHLVALRGRDVSLQLHHPQYGKVNLKQWSSEIFVKLKKIAILLDQEHGTSDYSDCIHTELLKLMEPSRLPSARIINDMATNHESFLEFGMRKAENYKSMNREERKVC